MFETAAFSFLLAIGLIKLLMPMAAQLGLVDAPCVRKRHHGEVPLIGGLAIYAALVPLSLATDFSGKPARACGSLPCACPCCLLAWRTTAGKCPPGNACW
jgi:UDP-N-acetylmuramyl pentapeptide phosphotransferase/UDP-N-acetylglucosamine-1-phosphate transferase